MQPLGANRLLRRKTRLYQGLRKAARSTALPNRNLGERPKNGLFALNLMHVELY
jgi:hypothetical protein